MKKYRHPGLVSLGIFIGLGVFLGGAVGLGALGFIASLLAAGYSYHWMSKQNKGKPSGA